MNGTWVILRKGRGTFNWYGYLPGEITSFSSANGHALLILLMPMTLERMVSKGTTFGNTDDRRLNRVLLDGVPLPEEARFEVEDQVVLAAWFTAENTTPPSITGPSRVLHLRRAS